MSIVWKKRAIAVEANKTVTRPLSATRGPMADLSDRRRCATSELTGWMKCNNSWWQESWATRRCWLIVYDTCIYLLIELCDTCNKVLTSVFLERLLAIYCRTNRYILTIIRQANFIVIIDIHNPDWISPRSCIYWLSNDLPPSINVNGKHPSIWLSTYIRLLCRYVTLGQSSGQLK